MGHKNRLSRPKLLPPGQRERLLWDRGRGFSGSEGGASPGALHLMIGTQMEGERGQGLLVWCQVKEILHGTGTGDNLKLTDSWRRGWGLPCNLFLFHWHNPQMDDYRIKGKSANLLSLERGRHVFKDTRLQSCKPLPVILG